jgi:hypothetical protein
MLLTCDKDGSTKVANESSASRTCWSARPNLATSLEEARTIESSNAAVE